MSVSHRGLATGAALGGVFRFMLSPRVEFRLPALTQEVERLLLKSIWPLLPGKNNNKALRELVLGCLPGLSFCALVCALTVKWSKQ